MKALRSMAGAAAVILVSAAPALAVEGNPFDGKWSGEMEIEVGLCWHVRTLDIEIRDGQITGEGGRGMYKLTMQGSVEPDGTTSRTLGYSTRTLLRIINGKFSGNEAFLSVLADAERMTGGAVKENGGSGECFGTISLTKVGDLPPDDSSQP